jgi:uncharacterized protein YbjT (DUF2867 family)
MQQAACRRTVLVIGARGFLGGYIVTALHGQNCRVLHGVRAPRREAADERRCDFTTMLAPDDWHAALAGVDAVVNAAGILRESGAQTFEAVHERGPHALAQACVSAGVKRFVQISALGDPRDGEFIASKHRFDARLLALPLDAVVLRPSVVYATEGSYGGTSLLRALAALPFGIWLPGDGHWRMQPLPAQDLAELVARAIGSDTAGLFEVGGAVVSLSDYQRRWRSWLRIPGARSIRVPVWLVSLQVGIAERLGRSPMSAAIWRMLRRGNTTAPDARARLGAAFDFEPRTLDQVLASRPSQVQDRWHARLYFMAPLLRSALVALWLISGCVGLLTPAAQITAFTAAQIPHPVELARLAGCVDLVFAAWLASAWRIRWSLAGMMTGIVVYTIAFSVWLPAAWLEPLGGLAKNLVQLPALAVLWVLSDRR